MTSAQLKLKEVQRKLEVLGGFDCNNLARDIRTFLEVDTEPPPQPEGAWPFPRLPAPRYPNL